MIEFRVLGALEVVRDGEVVPLGRRQRRAVLAILLLNAGRVVSAAQLADDLYAGATPATAVTQVHRQVSELRRLLPEARLETTPPGYVLRVDPSQLDLRRFESLAEQGLERLELGDASGARASLREALGLWRGPALGDLADEHFAQSAAARLEELRLGMLERRLEADLALGRATDVVPELDELVAANPLRERLVELLMLALYRAGRQADALAVYRAQRALLARELGLEPGPSLRRLEAAILRQDPDVAAPARESVSAAERPVVVAVSLGEPPTPGLVEVAVGEAHETILAQLVTSKASLTAAAAALAKRQSALGPSVRAAAFVAGDWQDDVLRFADAYDAALVLLDAPPDLTDAVPVELLVRATADVGLVVRGGESSRGAIFVPFGGGDHDWAALELAAAVARTSGRALRLVGTDEDVPGRRDSSRLLADASLAVQRAFAVTAAPVLAPAAPDALVAVVEDAGLVVAGIGSRWRSDGIGAIRAALVADARSPVVLVHRGLRPGILAPRETRTRYTWSLQN